MYGNTQIVFVDTPGIFEPRHRLDRAMVHAAWEGAGDADLVLLMIDASRKGWTRIHAALSQGFGSLNARSFWR